MAEVAINLAPGADLDSFRAALRSLVARGISPDRVAWDVGDARDMFGDNSTLKDENAPPVQLPRDVVELIRLVVCHRDRERYALLYALVWRVLHGAAALLEVASDPLVHRLHLLAKAVRRDIHKMHAFLRFRPQHHEGGERLVAWFEPEHHILRAAVPFFVDRFRNQVWTIGTPEGSAHWNGDAVSLGPPADRPSEVAPDAFAAGWNAYYESTFNPARLNLDAMRKEMPRKYWRNMPEARVIPALVAQAQARVTHMIDTAGADARRRDPVKAVAAMRDGDIATLDELNAIIARSEPMVAGGMRAVLGEGPSDQPAIAFVGEQPGDQEDLVGRPFVGPAGQLLTRAMAEAGIDRSKCYLTNAVKHFKHELRGKRRIHQKPTMGEIKHYRWWLMKEMDLVMPRLVVALGGSAVAALTGKAGPVTRMRGAADLGGRPGFATVHPSYLLRIPDPEARDEAYAAFVDDLRQVAARPEARAA